MTNPEIAGDSSATANESTSQENTGVVKSAFLEKVSDIPVVNAAKEYGTAAYNQVKQSVPLANYTLSKAESTLLYFALAAKPFLDKYQPQATLVDSLAVRGLEVVESKAPFIMKTPEELVEEARKLCASTLETGYQKAGEVKDLSTGALSSVKNYGLQKVSDCLSGTDKLVDQYLPHALGETSNVSEGTTGTIGEQATRLTSKVGQRVYGHSVKQFFQVQQLSQDSVAKLLYTIELLQHLKGSYKDKTAQEIADDFKVKASWIWEELSKEPADATEADKSLQQRMLSFARRITSVLVHTYSAVPSNVPQACMDGVQTARHYAAELFTQFDQAIISGEIASTFIQRVRDTLSSLEGAVRNMRESAKAGETIEMEELKSTDNAPNKEAQ